MFQNHLNYALGILTSRTVYESNVNIGMKSVSVTGFDAKNLEHYLHKLAMNDSRVIQSVLNVWKAHPKVRQMCSLPLHMAIIIAISNHSIVISKYDSIQTRTQIYAAFMNATVNHYHSDWNSISLRNCILNNTISGQCTAFKTLHNVAFEMIFKCRDTFPEYHDTKVNVRNLGFVDMIKVDSLNLNQVRYVFSHPTFLEFFAALHLTTLPHEKQSYYMALYADGWSFMHLNDVWNFFFGLMGDFYAFNTSLISELLYQVHVRYTQRVSTGVCDYEMEMQFLKFIREIGWTGEALGKLLLSAKVIVNSSLCIEYTDNIMNESSLIIDILKSGSVHRFQLSTRIHFDESLLSYWILTTLENQTNTLEEEYLKLIHCLRENSKCMILPSVTSFHIRSWRMSDNLYRFVHSISKYCTNMVSLHIEIISKPTAKEVDEQRNLLLRLVMDLNPVEELALSMDCCLLSAVLGEQGGYVTAKHLHLVFSRCHFVDDVNFYTYTNDCHIVPVGSAFKNLKMIQSLTVDSPINDAIGGFKVLLDGLEYLQHFHIINIDKRTMNQVLEYLSQTADLQTLEISHTFLGDNEMEKLCEYLPQNLSKFSLCYTDLNDYQASLLSDALKNRHSLISLDLSSIHISNESLKYILKGLQLNRHLRSLDISFNEIGEEHIDLLTQLQTLHHLNIQGYALPPTCKHSMMNMFLSLHELQTFYSCILFSQKENSFCHPSTDIYTNSDVQLGQHHKSANDLKDDRKDREHGYSLSLRGVNGTEYWPPVWSELDVYNLSLHANRFLSHHLSLCAFNSGHPAHGHIIIYDYYNSSDKHHEPNYTIKVPKSSQTRI